MRPAPDLAFSRPRSRAGGAVVVLGLHALALLGALRLAAWGDRQPPPPERPPLLVWQSVAPPPARADGRVRSSPPAAAPRAARTPQAITLPPPAATPEAAAETAAATAPQPVPQATPAAGPAVLNLALPRGASAPWRDRNPALDDPRSNTPRPTLESRIAKALGGSDLITEFRLEDGSVRLRRGNACVVVRPNRSAALDPYNGSAQLRPRLLDRC